MVVRTGSSTAKGNLIRSIMFPKNMDFEFYLDSIKFVIIMFIIATIGMAMCAYLYIIREVNIVGSKHFIDYIIGIIISVVIYFNHFLRSHSS